jgi:hypothetical protein
MPLNPSSSSLLFIDEEEGLRGAMRIAESFGYSEIRRERMLTYSGYRT